MVDYLISTGWSKSRTFSIRRVPFWLIFLYLPQPARLIGTGTFGCGSTIVEGEDFIAENITFENSAPQVMATLFLRHQLQIIIVTFLG